MYQGFVWYLGVSGPKLDPSFGMNPYSETKNWAHLAVFYLAFVASSSRRRGLGKRTAFESSSPDTCGETPPSFSLFPSSTTNSTVAPGESAEFVRPLSRSNSSGDR